MKTYSYLFTRAAANKKVALTNGMGQFSTAEWKLLFKKKIKSSTSLFTFKQSVAEFKAEFVTLYFT